MKIPPNVKKKDGLWNLLPKVYSKETCTALYPNIYLAPVVWDGISKNPPDPYAVCVLIHEQEHIKRQKKYGFIRWSFRYIFSSGFRIKEEFAATKPQFKYLKETGHEMDLKRRAKKLSSFIYLWGITEQDALSELNKLWKQA